MPITNAFTSQIRLQETVRQTSSVALHKQISLKPFTQFPRDKKMRLSGETNTARSFHLVQRKLNNSQNHNRIRYSQSYLTCLSLRVLHARCLRMWKDDSLPTSSDQPTSTPAHKSPTLRLCSAAWGWASNARNMSRLWTSIKWKVKCVSSWYCLSENYVTMIHGQQNIKMKDVLDAANMPTSEGSERKTHETYQYRHKIRGP
jgi:hypothetical protein